MDIIRLLAVESNVWVNNLARWRRKHCEVLKREFKLALACCRWRFSGVGGDEIRRLFTCVDWAAFLKLVRRHRVQAIVAQALSKNGVLPPLPASEGLKADAFMIGAHNLRAAAESMRLLNAFDDHARILFVKGLTLSKLAYGDPFVKMSSDIDILVEPNELTRAAEILAGFCYRPIVPAVDFASPLLAEWHTRLKESVWESINGDLVIELHTRLADNPKLIPAIGMKSPRQWVPVGPGKELPTLTTDDLFAYLCVHGASSAWFRLKWIADLAGLIHKGGPDEVVRLYRASQRRFAGRAAAQALLLADRLSLSPLPGPLRAELGRDKVNRLLASVALRELVHAAEPTKRFLGTAGIHFTQPFLLEGWPFKVSEVKRQVRDVIRGLA